ncbi:fibronectin type III domain-containing protein, partial [Salmonella sp. s55962]|uniref:fibronectin type III domain-containing protein n=1 Tax=Salmonella sp. s55962 TaxID=3159685 RepID=UPI003980C0A2
MAENNKGRAETRCRVDVAEEPDVPSRPKVALVSSKEAFLTWKTEHQPGKPDITGYTLLFKEYGEEAWQTYRSEIIDACVYISNLKP